MCCARLQQRRSRACCSGCARRNNSVHKRGRTWCQAFGTRRGTLTSLLRMCACVITTSTASSNANASCTAAPASLACRAKSMCEPSICWSQIALVRRQPSHVHVRATPMQAVKTRHVRLRGHWSASRQWYGHRRRAHARGTLARSRRGRYHEAVFLACGFEARQRCCYHLPSQPTLSEQTGRNLLRHRFLAHPSSRARESRKDSTRAAQLVCLGLQLACQGMFIWSCVWGVIRSCVWDVFSSQVWGVNAVCLGADRRL